MANRLTLQTKLEELLECRNVYFQPPASVKLQYRAIVYSFEGMHVIRANDGIYRLMGRYQLTLIDKNPDSEYILKVLQLPYCNYDRRFTADNLYHDVFTLYW